jgi:Right handed beta helix region
MLTSRFSSAQPFGVGNCHPHLVSYSTISEAVAAVPPDSTLLICPGNYPENVTIAQPLILRGPDDGAGIRTATVQEISVQGTPDGEFGPVDISNLNVNGDGGGTCGIDYEFASGTIDNVEVNGCGIALVGSPFSLDTVNISKSDILDFDGTGISASSNGATGFIVNVSLSSIATSNSSTGLDYEFTDGVVEHNTFSLAGGVGLFLNNFFDGMKAKENTIIGAGVGIYLTGNIPNSPTLIAHNTLINSGTGIFIGGLSGFAVIESNVVVHSSAVAIDLHCNQQTTTEYNTISGAPVGIADVSSVDTLRQNAFYNVLTPTTTCP